MEMEGGDVGGVGQGKRQGWGSCKDSMTAHVHSRVCPFQFIHDAVTIIFIHTMYIAASQLQVYVYRGAGTGLAGPAAAVPMFMPTLRYRDVTLNFTAATAVHEAEPGRVRIGVRSVLTCHRGEY